MVNHFNRLEFIARELQRYNGSKKVAPVLSVGGKIMPIEMALQEIARQKVRFISFYLVSKGIRVKKATHTESIYFYINGQQFRVSDHKTRKEEYFDRQFIVRFDSCVVQVLASIRMAHFKPVHNLFAPSHV